MSDMQIIILPSLDYGDYASPDAADLGSYAVMDISPDNGNGGRLLGFVGYIDHMGVWAFQCSDHSVPTPAFDRDTTETSINAAVELLISASPF